MDRELKLKIIFDALDKLSGPMKRISEGSKQMRAAMAESRRDLRHLQDQANDISAFRKLKGGLSDLKAEWKASERYATQMGRDISAVAEPTKAMTREFEKAKREAAQLKQEYIDKSAKLQTLRGRLSDAGISTRNLSEHERQLRNDMARTTREIDQQKDRIERLNRARQQSEKMQALGSQMTSAGQQNIVQGGAILAPFVLATRNAMEFSSGMVDIQQKAGLTNAELVKMRGLILAASRATHQLPEDMRAAVDVLAGFGMDPRQAVLLTEPIGRLGTAMKVDLADAAAAAYANINNLKVPIGETARAFDIMAAAGNAGAFEIRDMARWFPQLTAQARALGQEGTTAVADLSAALQIARRGAGSADQAANNVANLLAKINSAETIRKFQQHFGVDLPAALKQAYAKGKTPLEAIAEIANKATGGDLTRLSFMFEDQQAQSALRSLILDMEDYRKIRSDIANSGGTVDAAFDQRVVNDGMVAWQAFKVQLAGTALTLGTKLLPVASEFLTIAGGMATAVGDFAKENPKLTQTLLTIIAAAGGLSLGVGALQLAFGGVFKVIGMLWPLLTAIAPLFSGFFSTLAGTSAVGTLVNGLIALTGPIGLVVAGVAVAAALIYFYWDEIKAAFDTAIGWIGSTWEWLKTTFQTTPALFGPLGVAAALIYGIFSGIGTFIASAFESFWQAIQPLRESVGGLFTAIGELGAAILGWIGRSVGPWTEGMASIGGSILRIMGMAIQPFLDLVASIGGVIGGAITVALGWINQLVGPAAMAFWDAWGASVGRILGLVTDKLSGFIDWVTSGVSALTDFFNAAGREPKAASGRGRGAPANPAAPKIAGKRALGGPVLARRLYLVGENGPELFEAPMSGRIIPNYKMGNMTNPRGSRGLAMAGALAAMPMAAAAQPAPPTMPNIQALEVATSITAPAPLAMPALDALTAIAAIAPPAPPPMPALDALSIMSSIAAPDLPPMPTLDALRMAAIIDQPAIPPAPQFAPARPLGATRDREDRAPLRPGAPASATTINITIQQLPGEDAEALARRVADLIDRRSSNRRLGAYRDE